MKPLPPFSTAATSEGNRIYKVKRPAKLDASAAGLNGWYDGELLPPKQLPPKLPPKKAYGLGAPAGADSGPPKKASGVGAPAGADSGSSDDEDVSGPPSGVVHDDW